MKILTLGILREIYPRNGLTPSELFRHARVAPHGHDALRRLKLWVEEAVGYLPPVQSVQLLVVPWQRADALVVLVTSLTRFRGDLIGGRTS